ncbi:family 1 extracellular solute-binding protein [Paenibacillus mucilaginosus 3016]|uniref:Family 1 extracellular solute-binding protein n=1 Tax=Paenibacillus mucilaginosus 3016 TaxID=1116391 RepID=H6NPI2_9BACL|nr:extracellular solute-binding protein [Paenibacillus mucilaginosus]AFC32594.1 family 1 extracellular solute-binding protein [Paenibacillus mucilaginosus 3016]WFA21072.1 extracellular solute-binding protein [Paenibacillus mucilaginosus]
MRRGRGARGLALTVALMLAGTMAACSSDEAGPSGKGGEEGASGKLNAVTLKIMFPGDPPANWSEVKGELEKRLADSLNVKLNVVFIPWADVMQKRQVALSSAEDYDLIWDNNPVQSIAAGLYEPLDELIEKYGPDIKSTRSPQLLEANKVNGKLYAVPLEVNFIRPWTFVIRKDIREKLGVPPIKSYDELVRFMYTVKEKVPGITPFIPNGSEHVGVRTAGMLDPGANLAPVLNYAGLYTKGNDGKVYNIFDDMDPMMMKNFEMNHKFYKDGIFPKDVLLLKNGEFSKGKAAVTTFFDFGVNLGTRTGLEKSVPGATAEAFSLYDPGMKLSSTYKAGNYIAVPVVSKNKERAIQFINALNQKDNYDLLAYGIKGKNWEDAGEGLYKPIKENPYTGIPFAWGWNPKLDRIDATMDEEVIKLNQWERDPNNFTADILSGFTFDPSPVSNEIAQLSSMSKELFEPVVLGVIEPNEGLAKFKEKAYGHVKKIQAEYQKQLDAYLAGKKK